MCGARVRRWRFRDRDPDENLLEQLQDAGARLRRQLLRRQLGRRAGVALGELGLVPSATLCVRLM